MKKLYNHISRFLFLALLTLSSCLQDEGTMSVDRGIPDSRSFRMGFTAFPYDATQEALDESFNNVAKNGDIILSHFDNGVPWNEAFNDLPFPNEVQSSIDAIVATATGDHKVMLSATSTNTSRAKLADYWNDNGPHQGLPSPWNVYTFNNPQVVTAYIKYCRRLIDAVKPDYFAYGIEINGGFRKDSANFNDYLVLADTVYNTLKKEYPDISIFQSFQDQSFNKTKQELLNVTEILLAYSDMVAVSTYPFWQYDFPTRDANPELLSDDWLKEIRNLDKNKPFAVSETGFCAENLQLDNFGVNIKGNEVWQADYIQKLLKQADELNAEFVIWFVYRDYDRLYDNTQNPPSFFRIWKDNGLLDGDGKRRFAHDFWDIWKALPVN